MKYGHFSKDGKSYRIDTLKTPTPWKNLLFNDEYFMEVSQRLSGQSSAVKDYNRTPVLKPEKHFFAKIADKKYALCQGKGKTFSCEHYIHKTVVTEEFDDFISQITIFVPNEGQYEMWNLEITNKFSHDLSIDIFACYEFENDVYLSLECTAEQGYFCKSAFPYHVFYDEYEKAKAAETKVYAMSDKPLKTYECSRRRYWGYDAPSELPLMIENGFGSCIKSQHEDCVAAFHNEINIKGSSGDSVTYIIGIEKDEGQIKKIYNNMPSFSDELKKAEEKWNEILSPILVDTNNTEFNHLVNYWLKKQMVYLARHNRGGVYCPVRNQLQDAMGYAVINPEEALKLGLDVLRGQNENGYLKQYHMTDGSPERGLCLIQHSDGCVWLIICMIEIINLTKKAEYFELKEGYIDSDKKETVLTHLKKAAFYMASQLGEHGLCLMKDGDWTDPINGAGRLGRGESTWNTLALIYAIKKLLKVEYDSELDRIQKELTDAVNKHCWDVDRYIVGIDDNGIPFGSRNDEEASLFLNTQTWAIFAEVCDSDKLKTVQKTIETLKTNFGYLLLAPAFTKWNKIWGKISVKQSGTSENGAVYSHANMFKAYADFYTGNSDLGFETMLAAMPINEKNPPEKNLQIPIFLPNFYFGAEGENFGRSSNFYQSGATAWVLWLANVYLKKN